MKYGNIREIWKYIFDKLKTLFILAEPEYLMIAETPDSLATTDSKGSASTPVLIHKIKLLWTITCIFVITRDF